MSYSRGEDEAACFGSYYCRRCRRSWTSAKTWCKRTDWKKHGGPVTPLYAEDCRRCGQALFAYKVVKLDGKKRRDAPNRGHIQALCHRCRDRPFPCSTRLIRKYQSRKVEEEDYSEDDDLQSQDDEKSEEEDDDLQYEKYNDLQSLFAKKSRSDSTPDICTQTQPQTAVRLSQARFMTESECNQTLTQPQSPVIFQCRKYRKRPRNQDETESFFYRPQKRMKLVHQQQEDKGGQITRIANQRGWIFDKCLDFGTHSKLKFTSSRRRLSIWIKKSGLLSAWATPVNAGKNDFSIDFLDEELLTLNNKINR